ncbi:hypothetical protein [Azospirillum picis]|uniref:Uncharacterized protein n=1 Tax=Azospirillum picis TaxID=488438 RepID=A0ABU0MP06_9PROT|nr:hypothetical protein [Azospirillum picis]MBP2301315.1 hypothetical protein [Azospirillum picis]MDQ0535146.1 hypothetical protein [Azospirillum picis]
MTIGWADAVQKLVNGYWNSDPVGPDNLGGFDEAVDGSRAGHEENFPAALEAVGVAAQYVGQTAQQAQEAVNTIAASQSTLSLNWDAGTADADPGAGEVRASIASLTAGNYTLYVSVTNADGGDATNVLAGYAASTSATKGRLRLVTVGNSSRYVDVNVTGIATATGYRKVSVAYVAGPGGFVAGDRLALGFARTGDKGDIGNTGPTGPAPTIVSTSTTSLAIGTGSKTLVTAVGLGLGVGANILVASTANAANWMYGPITAIAGTSITFNCTLTGGSGTLASWNVSQSGVQGPTGATGPAGAAGAGSVWYGTSAGTANAQTLSGPLAALTGHPSIEFIAGYTNTAGLILTVGTTAATAVRTAAGAVLTGGEVVAGTKYEATYDGSYWRLDGSAGAAGGFDFAMLMAIGGGVNIPYLGK